MANKIKNLEFPNSLTEGGFFIPTDYILMKSSFRKDLHRLYTNRMEEGSKVLDLNAGTDGIGHDLIAAGHQYEVVEQNSLVSDVLSKQKISVKKWRPTSIPHPENTFDLVLSLAFIEHLPTWIDALQQLLEIKKVLKPGGRFLIIAPNAPGMGATFWDDYKHGWVISRKRLTDIAEEVGFEVLSTRYSIGWITLRGGPLWAMLRFMARTLNALLNIPPFARLLEACGLGKFSAKVKKTIFELVAIEIRKPDGTNEQT